MTLGNRTPEQDYYRGVHSRIPLCCIKFFIDFWVKCGDISAEYWTWHHNTYLTEKVGYVRCPLCMIAGKKSPIHSCSESCQNIGLWTYLI